MRKTVEWQMTEETLALLVGSAVPSQEEFRILMDINLETRFLVLSSMFLWNQYQY